MAKKPFPFSVCKECCGTEETADLTEINEKIETLENDVEGIKSNIGDIDTALDEIITIQETLIGGDSK